MTTAELEYRIVYSIVVAGKSASFAEAALDRLFCLRKIGESPFAYLRALVATGTLEKALRLSRTGNYSKIERALRALVSAEIDLHTCSPEQLEEIHGIGPKTSRFFIIWTRPDADFAALDTHVLKWLRFIGHDAPKSTPTQGKRYAELQRIFLTEARARGMTARALDAEIWDWCSSGQHRNGAWPVNLQPLKTRA